MFQCFTCFNFITTLFISYWNELISM